MSPCKNSADFRKLLSTSWVALKHENGILRLNQLLEPTERRKRRDPEICVWDRFIRTKHWLLALSFATLYLEYKKFPLHPYAGYLVLILITLRTIWGFTGKVPPASQASVSPRTKSWFTAGMPLPAKPAITSVTIRWGRPWFTPCSPP